VIDKIMRKLNTTLKTAGTVYTAGTFVFMNSLHFRLLISTPTEPRNFYVAVPSGADQRNMGVRFAMKVLEFDCYQNENGVLWDQGYIVKLRRFHVGFYRQVVGLVARSS
jgi:hypothetical protein